MGIGHLAVGLASKRWSPATSLGWLVAAAIFVDMLFGVFFLVGIEHARIVPGITKAMPLDLQYVGVSHSLVGVLGWSVLFAGVHFVRHADRRAAVVLFVGVSSHFVLDWVSHRPDMPILPDGPRVGLGLWNYPVAALAIETAMLAVGVWIYVRTTRSRGPGGIGFPLLIAVLFAINVGAYFGPPPPSMTFAVSMNLLFVFVVWALHRIDVSRELRHRKFHLR